MRLAQQEIENIRAELAAWHPPPTMTARAADLMEQIGDSDFFNQPGLSFIREAWVAGMFGKCRAAECVRLVAADRPDIALRFSDAHEEGYEVAEADVPRQRGGEYRAAESKRVLVGDGPVQQWATGPEAFDAIRRIAEKKSLRALELQRASMPYPPGTSLLIYLNVGDYGAHQDEIESTFQAAAMPAKDWFSVVWILWKLRAYRV